MSVYQGNNYTFECIPGRNYPYECIPGKELHI